VNERVASIDKQGKAVSQQTALRRRLFASSGRQSVALYHWYSPLASRLLEQIVQAGQMLLLRGFVIDRWRRPVALGRAQRFQRRR